MNGTNLRSCTVCGNCKQSMFLWDKENDSKRNGRISLYRCKSCSAVYLGEYAAEYDSDLYAYYARYRGRAKEQVYDPLTKKSYKQVLELIKTHGGGNTVLDVGCGKGDFVDVALSAGLHVEGIDLSDAAVEVAQGFGLPVTNLDFLSTEIRESSRDVVTMFEVIEHLPNPLSFLRRAAAVVRPGGLVYLTTPNFNSIDRRVMQSEWEAVHREHLTYFTPSTLVNAIRNGTDLRILHLETRNVSTQLIDRFRRVCKGSSWGEPMRVQELPHDCAALDIRAQIDRSVLLLWLKSGINAVLNKTGLGSTIVILLQRPVKTTEYSEK